MLRLKNLSMGDVLAGGKQIAVFGAGYNLGNILAKYETAGIENRIAFVIDTFKRGRRVAGIRRTFRAMALSDFIREADIEKCELIITINDYGEVLNELNAVGALDGMACYLWVLMQNHTEKACGRKLAFTPVKKYGIPRTIHYCWFGKKPLGEKEQACIESWGKSNPSFEIVEWNETNFDIEANRYIKEAYEEEKYGFVSDYARYAVLAEYGGFYFDVDVELLGTLDELGSQRGFISFESLNLLNSGSGFAAQKDDPFLCGLRDAYSSRSFRLSGRKNNETPCSVYETDYFRQQGVRIDDTFQRIGDFLILPHEFFAPVNQYTGIWELTDNTKGIHHFACSWFDTDMREEWNGRKEKAAGLNQKILAGWLAEKGMGKGGK